MDMTYEKVSKANIGVDLSFAKALDVTVEFFKEKRSDMFITPGNISSVMGAANAYKNLGKVENKGLEAGINYHKQIRNLNFHVGGNFSFNRSKVIESSNKHDNLYMFLI